LKLVYQEFTDVSFIKPNTLAVQELIVIGAAVMQGVVVTTATCIRFKTEAIVMAYAATASYDAVAIIRCIEAKGKQAL
jgi:hypothetical protein